MVASKKSKHALMQRRKLRVRKGLRGSAEKPRMSVFRSSRFIYVQLIDDESGKTLASSSSIAKGLREQTQSCDNKQQARLVGADIAKKAKEANIERVIFDRGPYKFHGRVQELAQAARENGLVF